MQSKFIILVFVLISACQVNQKEEKKPSFYIDLENQFQKLSKLEGKTIYSLNNENDTLDKPMNLLTLLEEMNLSKVRLEDYSFVKKGDLNVYNAKNIKSEIPYIKFIAKDQEFKWFEAERINKNALINNTKYLKLDSTGIKLLLIQSINQMRTDTILINRIFVN